MIDIEGNIYKLLPSYRIQAVKIVALIVSAVMAYIIRSIPYHPVTIIGTTFYSRVSAACLSQYNIPYVLCRGSNHVTYYETDDGKEIAFGGKGLTSTVNNIPLIKHSPRHSSEELKTLERHTRLSNLATIQGSVFERLPKIESIVAKTKPNKGPVIMIKPLIKDIYYVMSTTGCWLTRIIITDKVLPLYPGDHIAGVTISAKSNEARILEHSSQYIVTTDLRICSANLMINHDMEELQIYSLAKPRPLNPPDQGAIYVVHPFHLPATWNPLLSIMLVTLGIISK